MRTSILRSVVALLRANVPAPGFILAFPMIAALMLFVPVRRHYLYSVTPTPVADGSVRCWGDFRETGFPLACSIERRVWWDFNLPPSITPRSMTVDERKAEYLAIRRLALDPVIDAAELRFLEHPTDGTSTETFWMYAVLDLLIAAALAALGVYAFRWLARALRAFVASRHPRPGCCVRCGYNLTGNVSGVCPECGRKVDSAPLNTTSAG